MSILPHPTPLAYKPSTLESSDPALPKSSVHSPGTVPGFLLTGLEEEWIPSSTSPVERSRGPGPTKCPRLLVFFPLFWTPHAAPNISWTQPREGEALTPGLACTSQDGEGLPPSRPALSPRGWTKLDRVKGALSPSPGRSALRFPRSAFVVGLRPLPAQPPTEMLSRAWGPRPRLGESRWCTQGPVSQVY